MNQPLIAAIPNYNMGESLHQLLPILQKQDYDRIIVIDDASTDESCEIARAYPGVEVIGSDINRGAGAARTRILGAVGEEALLHFIDADTIPETNKDIRAIAAETFTENTSFVAGLVREVDGQQNIFNYGPRFCAQTNLRALRHMSFTSKVRAAWADHLPYSPKKDPYESSLRDFPDIRKIPEARDTFWGSEANMLIKASTFRELGGYDTSLREHEIQDLALRAAEQGLQARFEPAFAATHYNVQVRPGNRELRQWAAMGYLIRKHGLRNWLTPA